MGLSSNCLLPGDPQTPDCVCFSLLKKMGNVYTCVNTQTASCNEETVVMVTETVDMLRNYLLPFCSDGKWFKKQTKWPTHPALCPRFDQCMYIRHYLNVNQMFYISDRNVYHILDMP